MDATSQKPLKILLLGGTSEASLLAKRLARVPDISATLSLAGRTRNATASPLPVRVGGFGGADGFADHLKREGIELVLDATHPFAAQISANAIAACRMTGVPLLAVERPPWEKASGDRWSEHDSIEDAVAALPDVPANVFSALGRSAISALCAKPQHRYVIRVVDAVELPSELSHATVIAARGPFRTDDDVALFRAHNIACVLAKNSGGDAAYAKIEAARLLALPVYMVRRPVIAERDTVATVDEAMSWITRHHSPRAERGV
jgi:precorrin-6A/cobalt-precorrin-6A reductase